MALHRICIAGILLLAASTAVAQDNNYWTLQYGNQARLLGGAVIGSASDLSAVFYNPGRLALTDRPEFVIAGNILEFTSTEVGAEGTERTNGKTRFSLSPSLFAGELRFGWLGDGRLAYSFLTRQYSELRLQGSALLDFPAFGSDFHGAFSQLDHRLSEYWSGFTYAEKVSDTIGVGASMFVTTRSHRTGIELDAISLLDEQATVRAMQQSYEYTHWGLLGKLGVGTEVKDWDVGLAVTTPRLKLFSSGDVYRSELQIDRTGQLPDYVAINVGTDLPAAYKSPWSIGLGAANTFGANSVHVGVEWFAPVGTYTVLDAAAVPPQLGDAVIDADVTAGSGAVVNFAAGFQRRESERLRWYASVHSDFAAEDTEGSTNLSFTAWDLWHFGGGASFVVGTAEFTLGLIYARGAAEAPVSYESVLESRLHRLTMILGFNLPFGNPTSG